MAAKIEIYTTPICPFCHRAKSLLNSKGVAYEEIDLFTENRRDEMLERANGSHTVPQIFIDGAHVGGSDDLAALEAKGELDSRLGLA